MRKGEKMPKLKVLSVTARDVLGIEEFAMEPGKVTWPPLAATCMPDVKSSPAYCDRYDRIRSK